ncbi:MAG: 3-deoxy-7-phosphoheptulonate synthase class II [Actinobacteria bacterium]|nr:3-deoxy-7-phosphoheptulonate synthase class II [Actinomycetota bacterium]
MTQIQWPDLPAAQQPVWPDTQALNQARAELATLPPLIFAGEADQLRNSLGKAAHGGAFVLTAGDCAETFKHNTADSIRGRLRTVLQMAVVLTYGSTLPVVKIGRIAGQYFKPRSGETETVNGITLPVYRGDAVNDIEFNEAARQPDPWRMVRAYHASSATLNLVRAFTQGGYADLREVHSWNQDFVKQTKTGDKYELIASDIDRALAFMAACGVDPSEFRTVDFYSSHEALVLDYEQPLTRVDSRTGKLYDVSAHFLWIGDRTRQLDGAHIDFASRISNPIGIKIGPSTDVEDIGKILEKLNPDRTDGRITFISRMGVEQIKEKLAPLMSASFKSGHKPLWVCDPMHGNTKTASTGHKTRDFSDVIGEVVGFFDVCRAMSVHPGGIHIELTGDDVTECTGGMEGLLDHDLPSRYETACDPRLNRVQSLELAFRVSEMLKAR